MRECSLAWPARLVRQASAAGAPGRLPVLRAVLARGVPVPREPADLAVIGGEGAVRAALARLHDAGAGQLAGVVLPDPAEPAKSVERAHRLLAELA